MSTRTTLPEESTSAVDAGAETPTPEYRFNAQDRCDTCGAQAYIGAVVSDTELIYCAHHGRKYESRLRAAATVWHDETQRLLED